MSNSGKFHQIPATIDPSHIPPEDSLLHPPGAAAAAADPTLPLRNLSAVRERMDSLQRFLSDSVSSNTLIGKHQMDIVSAEIAAAIHQVVVNGAALLARSQPQDLAPPSPNPNPNLNLNPSSTMESLNQRSSTIRDLKCESEYDEIPTRSAEKSTDLTAVEAMDDDVIGGEDWEIIELDAVELLAEHVHFCDICGKGFKRDANLRMHMRAHGNEFKTAAALAKPPESAATTPRRSTRFSCPYLGCNRNKSHKKFRPLKSAICVKNHFKRSHCPKIYSCNECNKKSFSVVADLKSHLKHCGKSKWKCSCGTSFSRKDKLFGHMALFEGHMPAVAAEEEEEEKKKVVAAEEEEAEEDGEGGVKGMEMGVNGIDNGFFEGLIEGFGSIENYFLQDELGLSNGSGGGLGTDMNGFYSF